MPVVCNRNTWQYPLIPRMDAAARSRIGCTDSKENNLKSYLKVSAMIAALAASGWNASPTSAQGTPGQRQGAGGRGAAAAPTAATPSKLDLSEGTKARYRVQENLAGLNILSDA